MSTEVRVVITQVVGLVVIIAAKFGVPISPEEEATIIAALSSLGLLITIVVAKWKKIREVFGAGGNAAAILLAVLISSAMLLPGCVTKPSFSNVVLATSASIEEAAKQVDAAERTGLITNETEDRLLDKLKGANDRLRQATRVYAACGSSKCSEAQDIVNAINALLAEVTAELIKE